jgi:cytochrome c553
VEPIVERIIELGQDEARQMKRDPYSGTVAYVPAGSVARGEALAGSSACAGCHGADLKGLLTGPHLAGRSPTYLFRQLYAFKTGARQGPDAELMAGIAAPLSSADMIDLSAYIATLAP